MAASLKRWTCVVITLALALALTAPVTTALTLPGLPKVELDPLVPGLPDLPDPPYVAPLDLTPPPKAAAPHPRLLFSEDDLPRLRQRVSVHGSVPQRALETMRRSVAAVDPGDPVLDRPGRHFGRQDLADTALMWLLTQKSEYLAKAKSLLVAIAATAPNYGAPEVFDATEYYNTRAHILGGLALAWDWLYEALTAQERAMLLAAIATLGSEHFAHSSTTWWGTISTGSNFTGNNGAAIGIAGLAVWGDLLQAPLWVARGRQLVESYFEEGFDRAGAGYEGVLYGNYGLRIPTYFSAALARAGASNPLLHPKIRRQPRWVAYEVLPGGGAFNPLNDARYYDLNPAHTLWASSNGADPDLAGWIWRNISDRTSPVNVAEWVAAILWWREPDPAFAPSSMLPLSQGFLDRGLVHVRSGWRPDDLMASFESRQYDYGEGVHRNQDANHFTLYAYGARLAVDSGYANWDEQILAADFEGARSSETEGHNAVEADGRTQDFYGKGDLVSFASGPGIDVAQGDARLGYLVLQPQRADRWFVHLRSPDGGPGYVAIADAFRQDASIRDYSWYLHTEPGNAFDVAAGDPLRAHVSATNGAGLSLTITGTNRLAAAVDVFTSDYPDIGKHQRLVVSSRGSELMSLAALVPTARGAPAAYGERLAATGGVALGVGDDVVLYRTAAQAAQTGTLRSDGVLAIDRGEAGFALIDGGRLSRGARLLAEVLRGPATIIAGPSSIVVSGAAVDSFRIWGPGVKTVTVNGHLVPFARCGPYVVAPPAC